MKFTPMKRLWLTVLLPGLAAAAIWPETMGPWKRTRVQPAAVADRPLWDEYGLREAERATFENGERSFEGAGYRLADPTAALGAYQWQRPAGGTRSKLAALAAETPKSAVAVHGNLLLVFDGYKPSAEEYGALVGGLRNVDTSALPTLTGFLPSRTLVAGSERYIIGPAGLEKFNPGIPPSVAAFSMGAEAQIGVYESPKGDMKLALFNYPTPQIAIQRYEEFQKVPGVMAKRSGPIVAAMVAPADRDAAEKLLAEVRYEAQITLSEYVPTQRDNIGNLIINAFVLIGILLGFSVVAGLAFGGVRAVRRLVRRGEEPEAMIALHLENR
jgi:hypothetical protein